MKGEPIEAVKTGLRVMLQALLQDPSALESVFLSVITFDAKATVLCALTPLDEFVPPNFVAPDSGPTHLGLALERLLESLRTDIITATAERKGDWAPFLIVMTDGKPSDTQLYKQMCPRIRDAGFASVIGCVAGPKAKVEDLAALCDHIVTVDTMDVATFSSFFRWVSGAITRGSRSLGTQSEITLPPPPAELCLVV
jgi:uncharacterized protein YegL